MPIRILSIMCAAAFAAGGCSTRNTSVESFRSDAVRQGVLIHNPRADGDIPEPDGHVVILSGILGPLGGPEALVSMIKTGAALRLSAQTWRWDLIQRPKSRLPGELGQLSDLARLRELATASHDNRMRGRILAEQVRKWTKANDTKKLYLVGGSAGAMIVWMACQAKSEDGSYLLGKTLERIVFISATVPSDDKGLEHVLDAAKDGVFNYSSHLDQVLLGTGFSFSAGVIGFTTNKKDIELYQLRFYENQVRHKEKSFRTFPELGNHGGHQQCYAMPFCRKYILPLFYENKLGELKMLYWRQNIFVDIK